MGNIKSTYNQERGFTIVELLIVIVVIGILAAITIVSFNGVTARANSANAQSAAEAVVKKVEAYNAEVGSYPTTFGTLTASAASAKSYYVTGLTLDTTVLSTSNLPATPSEINFLLCGTGSSTTAPTTAALVTTPTGAQINYWNYQTKAIGTMSTGVVTGGVVGTNNVGCGITS